MQTYRPPKYTSIEQARDVFTHGTPQAVLEHIQALQPQDKQALDAWAQVWRKRQGLPLDSVLGASGFALDAYKFCGVSKQDALLVATILQARQLASIKPTSPSQHHQGRARA